MVSGIDTDPVLQVVARSLVDLAGAIGAQVVAEGVETGAEAATLGGLGAGLGQGWLFARAVPAADLRDTYPVPAPSGPAPRLPARAR
jgi:EAL domain-containing protein (putative c-di-GMP-specific phosphodiesterase class I)